LGRVTLDGSLEVDLVPPRVRELQPAIICSCVSQSGGMC
jgi:hypothetical protein